MKRVFLVFAVLSLLFSCTKETIIQGAPGADGIDGKDGLDGASITATVVDLEVGSEECPNGGTIVTLFADGVQFDEIVTCNGLDGADGADGADGVDGADGADGADGIDGAVGPQGPAGEDGADGAVGPQGPAGTDGVDGQDGVDASGTHVYDWSGVWIEENELWSLEISNIIYYPTQTDNSNGFQNNKYNADVSLFGEVINTDFLPHSTLGTYYASSAVFYFNVVDNDNNEFVSQIQIRNIGSSSEYIRANHFQEENGIVTLVSELTFIKQ